MSCKFINHSLNPFTLVAKPIAQINHRLILRHLISQVSFNLLFQTTYKHPLSTTATSYRTCTSSSYLQGIADSWEAAGSRAVLGGRRIRKRRPKDVARRFREPAGIKLQTQRRLLCLCPTQNGEKEASHNWDWISRRGCKSRSRTCWGQFNPQFRN